ncbi:MAG: Sulfurtransferase TusA [Candidatus Heimdallarchaeota archaeon LC_3]|nr:MAG: Sulfurtransferase TusA [Candidatus Heimdallarchaeota archaeon LC_3]
MSVTPNQTLDARNMSCPMPVLKTKKAMKGMEIGHVLEIIATDPGSMKDMASFCRTTGQELISSEEKSDKTYRFLIKKNK